MNKPALEIVQIVPRGQVVWTAKGFKQRVREITQRNRGHRVQDVIDELGRYVNGWLHYFGIHFVGNGQTRTHDLLSIIDSD